jgi:hypothetical protein
MTELIACKCFFGGSLILALVGDYVIDDARGAEDFFSCIAFFALH